MFVVATGIRIETLPKCASVI